MVGNRLKRVISVSGSFVALRWIMLVLACVLSVPAWCGTPAPAITFVPAHPTSRDSTVATLSVPNCGTTSTFVVNGAQITVTTSAPGGCGTPPPFTTVTLGALPAGTYQVQWFEQQVLTATAPLVVAAVAVDSTPLLQPWALLLLAGACAALAFAKLRRRHSSD
jgi:hypothetical protein